MKITASVAGFSLALMLGVVPASEKVKELMPFLQASAFVVMAVNNGVQLAIALKGTKP